MKVDKNNQRALNELASKTKCKEALVVFVILFHNAKLRFETLKLVHSKTHVRTNHAPTTPE